MKEMLMRAWAQMLLAFAVGLLLISYKQEWRLADLVHHVGTAFVVAAVVTAFWHLREVSEVIEKYVKSILVDDSYLTRLELSALMELRSKAAKAILRKAADNPKYKREDLERWIDKLLYERLLPGDAPSAGQYRENYVERIVVEILSLEKALRCENLPTGTIPATELSSHLIKLTSTVYFTVISPHGSDGRGEGYSVNYSGEGSGLANFPMDKLIKVFVGNDQESAKQLDTEVSRDSGGQILTKAIPRSFKFENGECEIWMRVIEYKSFNRESFVLNTMGLLTRNLRAYIGKAGEGPSLVFAGQIIATPLERMRKPETDANGAWLEYDGWLFEDHGYLFSWSETPEERGNEGLDLPKS